MNPQGKKNIGRLKNMWRIELETEINDIGDDIDGAARGNKK